MDTKRIFKDRLVEVKGTCFDEETTDVVFAEVNKRAEVAIRAIVKEVVDRDTLGGVYGGQSLADILSRRKKRKQVIQEGATPFGQHVTGPEPGTVTGSPSLS